LIKVKGVAVAPAELEALLLEHSEIMDAAVIGIKTYASTFCCLQPCLHYGPGPPTTNNHELTSSENQTPASLRKML